jgi:hypothetical protein
MKIPEAMSLRVKPGVRVGSRRLVSRRAGRNAETGRGRERRQEKAGADEDDADADHAGDDGCDDGEHGDSPVLRTKLYQR